MKFPKNKSVVMLGTVNLVIFFYPVRLPDLVINLNCIKTTFEKSILSEENMFLSIF
jgi:hypothetical protein